MTGLILLAALTLNPTDLQEWYSHCSTGNWLDAADAAALLVEADSTNEEIMAAHFIAKMFCSGQKSDSTYAGAAVDPDSLSSLSWAASGLSLMESGSEQSEIALQKAIQLDSTGVFGWYLMGILREGQRDTLAAMDCYDRVIGLDTDFLPAGLQMARLLRDAGRQDDALDEFREIMDTETSSGMLAFAEYILLTNQAGIETGTDSLERILLLANPHGWLDLAFDQYPERPDISLVAAVRAENTLIEEDLLTDLSVIYLNLGEYSSAVSVSQRALDASADSITVLGILGEALFELQNLDESERVFLALLNLDPFSIDALNFLGKIAEREARTADAVDYYLKTLELDPFNSVARSQLRIIAGDSYYPDVFVGSLKGFSTSVSVDLSIEKGNRSFMECGGGASFSYRFDNRGTSFDAGFGGRTIRWEEDRGFLTDTLNTDTGWASATFDYWLSDSYYLEVSSYWDRQRHTVRPWQISSYLAGGWQKWISSWLWFSPELGIGAVNARWSSGTDEEYSNSFSIFASAGLWYRKFHTFIERAEISGQLFFPPDNPDNFISHGKILLAFRTWNPLYFSIGYYIDYTRNPEVSSWSKFNTSFKTALNFDLF